ncbi:MAG: radical SAM protein [Deltaproteobacteria bacterium]|jgi:MoaA/NifB/PqqE/SkfB family radical SAM enzyme|nr:radical SAM protein [Deltaproteobacteria bacterium]MBW2516609.1 radical SAM protein [Deltaproteobacteria bacterium]
MTVRKTVAFSKNSANLFFHILTECNLNCRHCYINPAQHGKGRVPLNTIKAWLDVFSDNSAATNLIFLGGEPTLHPNLAEAVKYARGRGFNSITIDTNGFLFHDILDKVGPEEVDFFSFSLDGATRKTNDALRGQGSYDACINGIRKTVSAGFATSLIYTVSRANLDELELMPALLSDLGINRFFIQVIGLRGKASGPVAGGALQVSRSEWMQMIPPLAQKIAARGITVSYPKVYLEPAETFECAGRVARNYFIFPNGRVYQCPLCEDLPIHSLELKDNQLIPTAKLNESDLFELNIPEGCVMNKLIQPGNISYTVAGVPDYKIGCCLLKEEVLPEFEAE